MAVTGHRCSTVTTGYCRAWTPSGKRSASIVHPREVYKSALLSSAAAILFMHNHPSGETTPSREDLEITTRLKKAEEKTRLAGAVNPLGALIHLPLWVASTVANLDSGSDNDDEKTFAPSDPSEKQTVEEGQPD